MNNRETEIKMVSFDKKMQERINRFNQTALSTDISQLSIGLYHGKMGLCVYFYELAHLTSEKKYRIAANKILNDIVNQVTESLEIGLSNGLTGICIAINFLLETGYAEGNPNHVLKNYDDNMIRSLLFNPFFESNPDLGMVKPVMESVAYLTIRLQDKRLSKNERLIMQGVVIEIINKMEALPVDKFAEPALFSVTEYFTPFYLKLLQRIYQLNFYNCKIEKIIDGLSPHILSMYPLIKANRLLVCSAMKDIQATVGRIPGWDKHIELLQQDIDNQLTIHEFKNKNIAYNNGLCGFYYLLRKIGLDKGYDNLFIYRIVNSEYWNLFFYSDKDRSVSFDLYNGIQGVILTYLHILYKRNSMMFFDKMIRQYV